MTDTEFAEIVNRTKLTVLSAIEKNLYPRFYHAIDDVVQETYLRAFRSLSSGLFRGDSSTSTWLYVIARNESLRMNKKLRREEEKFERSVDAWDTAGGNEDEPQYSVEEIQRAINLLPVKYRVVMESVYRGLSLREIAESQDLRHGTVKSRAARGREMLYKLLQEEYYETR